MDYETMVDQVMYTLRHKFDLARKCDCAFYLEHYEWILGGYIIDTLYKEMEMKPTDIDIDNRDRLWGLPVTIDRHDKWRISLLKEIK